MSLLPTDPYRIARAQKISHKINELEAQKVEAFKAWRAAIEELRDTREARELVCGLVKDLDHLRKEWFAALDF